MWTMITAIEIGATEIALAGGIIVTLINAISSSFNDSSVLVRTESSAINHKMHSEASGGALGFGRTAHRTATTWI
jgi:hypothetical protein